MSNIKVKDHIVFDGLKHTYTNVNTGELYTSVTTFTKAYTPVFDSDKVSRYKALEALLGVKPKYDTMYYVTNKILKIEDIVLEQYKILLNWSIKGTNATTKGTIIHNIQEHKESFIYDNKEYFVGKDIVTDLEGIYPEFLVYNDRLKIAGQIDLIIKTLEGLVILDYKTNKEIELSNKYSKLEYPFHLLDNCNFNVYSMQLSLYAYLLQELYQLPIKDLLIFHLPETRKDKVYRGTNLIKELTTLLK